MKPFFQNYWNIIKNNLEIFLVGALSTGFIPVAIFLHYLANSSIEAVILFTIAFVTTQLMSGISFPDFVSTKRISMARVRWAMLLMNALRILCIALAISLYPGDHQSEFLVILSFFIAFDVFLVGLPTRLAVVMLLTNATVLSLLYTNLFALIVFVVMTGAQIITYLIQLTFRQMIAQQNELITLNTKIDQISTEAERLRLRGDLHDTLGHELTALTLQVSMMQQEAQGDDAEHLESLKSRIKGVNHTLRGIIENRHINHDMTMQDIVNQQIRRVPQLKVNTSFPPSPIMLAPAVQRLLVSGVLELLTNCMKHGNEQDVSVVVTTEQGRATLKITNEISTKASEFVSSSIGLKVLSERLQTKNGALQTEIKNNHFLATVMVPFEHSSALL